MRCIVLAFDDSGGIESLCTWDGTPIAGDHPITVLTAFYVDEAALQDFDAAWDAMRADMQTALGIDAPPPIHLRLMWGKSLPRTYRGRPNPFLSASFEQIQAWVARAWAIVQEFVDRRQAGWFHGVLDRADAGAAMARYYRDPAFRAEMAFLRRHDAKLYRGYHRLATSPLLRLYTQALFNGERLAAAVGRGTTLRVLVDSFHDAHGIDEEATVRTMLPIAGLRRFESVDRVHDADEHGVIQAADLIGYSRFRTELTSRGAIRRDDALEAILGEDRRGQSITKANLQHLVRRHHRDLGRSALVLNYALARAFVEAHDSSFADLALISVEEFAERVGDNSIGVSVLTPWALSRMAKTPD